ncbi:molybdopterin-containing oxidoreductase family protein [Mycobacteroides saopaulense]|uniref:Formate dehydrogenase n=1 Tax=Mycobacteroides saopaulense TaxID=1578165 RepID=A0ABX3C4Z2_9MYCO|nr:molybdopterin-dependent oxidoreductase [Mycobacteroides saopaulense]OHT88707.1 formate dehydrogenase [Mycobacteroides saopaulense]OHU13526.1 formate dehydrogenase [Mycobacteroides saopaulense]
MTVETKTTFCRICEPLCGMIATVEDGKLLSLRPDKENPASSGFSCQKGIAFADVHNDPDRLITPMRRTPSGEFEPVDWDTAMADIAERVRAIHRAHGSGALGWYFGNPGAFSYSHVLWLLMLSLGFGSRLHLFTAGSQDINSRFVASQLLYGNSVTMPIPDIPRTDLLVVIGANPVVSHGSGVTIPRIRDHMKAVVKRGGRVLVIDPRRTETAADFEWLGIAPDGDAFLLLSLLQVMFEEGLIDRARLAEQASGAAWLEQLARPFTPESTQEHTGIDPGAVRQLARDLVVADRSVVYGRVGTCLGQNGTLTTYLLDVVNLAAGNLGRAGGSMFGSLGMPGERFAMKAVGALLGSVYRRRRSRIGGFPSVLASEPAGIMAKEITTPGRGQIRALFVGAGNPVLSVPNGNELEAAFAQLDLMVGIDLYVNETLAHCDYVLPATTMYERDDFMIPFAMLRPAPFRQVTEAVTAPAGQARQEWQIIDDLTSRLGDLTPGLRLIEGMRRTLAVFGSRLQPRLFVDALIRLSEGGDRFRLRRRGLTFDRLSHEYPHGKVLAEHLPEVPLSHSVSYLNGRVRLQHKDIETEVASLVARTHDPRFPMRLIGMREARSENSWMHNVPMLMRGGRVQRALIHAYDADRLGVATDDLLTINSAQGEIEVPAQVSKDILPGVVAVPHGWGHRRRAGWNTANANPGANVNLLMSSEPDDLEALAGMARLNGVPVRIQRA